MSGGSFDYLYSRVDNPGDLMERYWAIGEMETFLHRLQSGAQAYWSQLEPDSWYLKEKESEWPESQHLELAASEIREARQLIMAGQQRLAAMRDVLFATEWFRSNDYGPDQLRDALKKWAEDRK